MIEISAVTRPVSSPVSAKPEAPVAQIGTDPKAAAQQATAQQEKASEARVRKAVHEANMQLAGSNEKVGFVFEKRLGQLFVQVLDKETGKVVKEIPPREFIEHQAYMKEMAGILLDRNA